MRTATFDTAFRRPLDLHNRSPENVYIGASTTQKLQFKSGPFRYEFLTAQARSESAISSESVPDRLTADLPSRNSAGSYAFAVKGFCALFSAFEVRSSTRQVTLLSSPPLILKRVVRWRVSRTKLRFIIHLKYFTLSDWLQSSGLFFVTNRPLPYLEDVRNVPWI